MLSAHAQTVLAVGLLLLAAGVAAAVSGGGEAAKKGKGSRCKPSKLRLVRLEGEEASKLSWRAPRSVPKRKLAYRVYRSKKVVGQTKKRSMRINTKAGKTYVFAVTVRKGSKRGCTAKLKRHLDFRPPSKPGDLNATGRADTAVSFGWKPSTPGDRKITAYRVFRNDTVVGQVSETNARVANLAPLTGYGFSVAAVDSSGDVGPRSSTLSLSTDYPPPTQGYAHAFLLASTDQSFEDFQDHYRQIGVVYPTYYQCRSDDGAILGQDDPLITRYAQIRRVKVLPRFNCQSKSTLHTILTDPTRRAEIIDELVSLVDAHDYEGINIDFEAGDAADRNALTSFVQELSNRLHARGKLLAIEVSPKTQETFTGRSGFYDYRDLGAAADYVFVMSWGLHWSTSRPGPISPQSWTTAVADYTATMPNKHRYVLGLPMYGMDWPNGGGPSNVATALEYADIQSLSAAVGRSGSFDSSSNESTFTYSSGGVSHEVWFMDRNSLSTRIPLARNRGLGIGLWRLGREDQAIWSLPDLAPGVVWP